MVCWVLTDIMMIITIETTIEDVKIHFTMDVIKTMVVLMVILMEIIVIAIGIINQNQDIQTLGITGKVEQDSIKNIGGG